MQPPVLHPQTKTRLESLLKKPAHGILITGKEGSGKLYIATWLARQAGSDYIIIEAPEDKASISIEQIRELYNLTRTGSTLFIIIEDSHRLGIEAQNAFLKLLEEPPKNTTFILTATRPESLLATIRSRSQLIEILPPSKQDLLRLATARKLTEGQLTSLLHTSEGLAGTFFRLLEEREYTRHQASVSQAKQFYTADTYQRHRICTENKYDKAWAKELLALLAIIIRSLLRQTNLAPDTQKRLIQQSGLLEVTAHNLLKINGNPKIHLARLCQQL